LHHFGGQIIESFKDSLLSYDMENTYENILALPKSVEEKSVKEFHFEEKSIMMTKMVPRRQTTVKLIIPACDKILEEVEEPLSPVHDDHDPVSPAFSSQTKTSFKSYSTACTSK
jgi:hypothetical protein